MDLTAQSFKWKAYVGNVTGRLALDDADNYSIYEWNLVSFQGEVYATRKTAYVNWSGVSCANLATLHEDESVLNQVSTDSDSITSTFKRLNHTGFHAANEYIINSTCYTIYTHNTTGVQANSLDAVFQEVVLEDNNYTIYTTILELDQAGFDPNNTYDFQLLVPENPGYGVDPTTYYFYMELS